MHSSRMRTVCNSSRLGGGGSATGGSAMGGSAPRGVSTSWGVCSWGGGGIPACTEADPPCGQNDGHVSQLRMRMVIKLIHLPTSQKMDGYSRKPENNLGLDLPLFFIGYWI